MLLRRHVPQRDLMQSARFAPQQRVCGACKHFADESCRHPQAKDHYGKYAGMYRYLANPPPVWPRKGFNESCGWWRPNDGATP